MVNGEWLMVDVGTLDFTIGTSPPCNVDAKLGNG
jgi:hypothetical protein